MKAKPSWLREHWGAVALVLCAGLMFAVVWPVGEFPLNDDWAYSRVVQHFVRTGDMVFTGFTQPALVFQVLWGSLFVWLFGFSHLILRVSTLILAAAGALAVYALARELRAPEGLAALAGLVFLANPISTLFSFTFMTDVPFTALCAIAMWLYVRGIQRDDLRSLTLGGLAAAGAILIRQSGVLVPAGVALSLLFFRRSAGRRAAMAAAALAFPLVGVVIGLIVSRTVPNYRGTDLGMLNPADSSWRAFYDLAYVGLLTAPLGIGLLSTRPWSARLPRWTLAIGIAVAFGPGLLLLSRRIVMPYLTNAITRYGAFVPSELAAGMRPVILPGWAQLGLTAVALTGAAALGAAMLGFATRAEERGRRAAIGGLLIIAGLEIASFLSVKHHFDRYLLVLIPPAAAVLVATIPPEQARRAAWVGLPAAALLLIFGLLVTRDYFRWSAARWQAASAIAAAGVPADRIEGGFEWDGWHAPLPLREVAHPTPPPAHTPDRFWPWYVRGLFPHLRPEYVISDSPLPWHAVIYAVPYSSLLGGLRQVYILRPVYRSLPARQDSAE